MAMSPETSVREAGFAAYRFPCSGTRLSRCLLRLGIPEIEAAREAACGCRSNVILDHRTDRHPAARARGIRIQRGFVRANEVNTLWILGLAPDDVQEDCVRSIVRSLL